MPLNLARGYAITGRWHEASSLYETHYRTSDPWFFYHWDAEWGISHGLMLAVVRKQLDQDPFATFMAAHPRGSLVKGVVKEVEPRGAVIELVEGVEGYVRASDIKEERVEDATDLIEVEIEQHKAGVEGITGSVVLIFVGALMLTGGAEVLVRHAIPHVGNFMSTEAVLVTGAVDAMCVDVQCIKQGLVKVADCYDTPLITTNPRCHIGCYRSAE